MPVGKYESEKLKTGFTDGVAYRDGKGGHLAFASKVNTVKTGASARSQAAKNKMSKGRSY